MEMAELFNDDFLRYRALEIEEGVQVLREFSKGSVSVDHYMGAMNMLKRIVNLPKKLVEGDDKDQIKAAHETIQKALNLFERTMVRRSIEEPTVQAKDENL